MSTRLTATWLALILCAPVSRVLGAEPGQSPNVHELAELENFRGKWSGPVDNSDLINKATGEWILQGRVMQTRFEVSGQLEGLIHRTYDAAGKRYVTTFLDSSGTVVLANGDWDGSNRQMTVSGQLGPDTFKLTNRFLNDDTEEWHVVITRPDGSLRLDLSGTNHRQSD